MLCRWGFLGLRLHTVGSRLGHRLLSMIISVLCQGDHMSGREAV